MTFQGLLLVSQYLLPQQDSSLRCNCGVRGQGKLRWAKVGKTDVGVSRGAQQGAVEEGEHRQISKGWGKYIQQPGQRGFCLYLNLILPET